MSSDLESRFDRAMMDLHVRARDEAGHNATYYVRMLHEIRGLATARNLVYEDQPSRGFMRLLELERLDLTVEALVIQSEWQPLFADEPELLERARRRLANNGYSVETPG